MSGKIQLIMAINFISSKDSDKARIMHSKSDNIETMTGGKTNDIIKKHFQSLLQRYQEGLEVSMKGSEFIFDGVDLLYDKCYKISLNTVGSYIDSPKWLKNKKATINPKNIDDKCFQYAVTVALNHDQIKSHPGRISNIKTFHYSTIGQYNWKEIYFPSNKKN